VLNKRIKIILSLGFLLLVLLVISPCPVRNSIQRLVGVETTEVLNRSKSQLVEKHECVLELVKTELSKNFTVVEKIGGSSGIQNECPQFFCTKQHIHLSYLLHKEKTDVDIPLYILYKRLKYMC
jgi:hypothetical protein